MSGPRNVRLASTNSSSHTRQSLYQLFLATMLSPQLVGHRRNLLAVFQQRIVAMPLHEVGAAHEGAMIGGAALIVPQVEVNEVNRLLEGSGGEHAFAAPLSDAPL